MRYIIFILLTLVFFINPGYGQLSIITLYADYAAFRGNQDYAYVEIYLSFYQNNLTYQMEEDSLLVAHFSHTIEVFQNDSLVVQQTKKYKNSIGIQEKTNTNLPFINVFPINLPPGSYQLRTNIYDDVSKKMGKQEMEMIIPKYDSTFSISDIQLSTKIEKAETKNNYSLKNNITIYPKPSCIFDIYNPVLYFYFEGYNLQLDKNNQNNYSYLYQISDKDGNIKRSYPVTTRSTSITTIAEIKGINIISLQSDMYFLTIEATDSISGSKVSAKKMFYLKKPELVEETAVVAPSETINEYIDLTEKELIKEFEKLKYIANSNEKKIFKDLDAEGMKKFLVTFWKDRDPDPSTPLNEYKQTYYENIQIANNRFSGSFKEGWNTDRGRVLLMYGRPDEIERSPSSLSAKPYEVWHYYSLEGGCEFIFADLQSFGDYLLLHSTYRNEIKDYNWQDRIIEAGSASDF